MIKDLKKRYKLCSTSKDEVECSRLLSDTIIYIINKGWGFLLDIVELPFTASEGRFIVIRYVDLRNGLLKPKMVSMEDVIKGCESYDSFSTREKLDYIRKLLPLIPEGG